MLQQGTNEAGNTKEHYLLHGEKRRPRGRIRHNTAPVHYCTQTIHYCCRQVQILLLHSQRFPCFLPERGASATLFELRTRRTPKSRCIIYKRATQLISTNILTFGKCEVYHQIITETGTQPPASINSNPSPFALNNANTFP